MSSIGYIPSWTLLKKDRKKTTVVMGYTNLTIFFGTWNNCQTKKNQNVCHHHITGVYYTLYKSIYVTRGYELTNWTNKPMKSIMMMILWIDPKKINKTWITTRLKNSWIAKKTTTTTTTMIIMVHYDPEKQTNKRRKKN